MMSHIAGNALDDLFEAKAYEEPLAIASARLRRFPDRIDDTHGMMSAFERRGDIRESKRERD
jgi:hypothetical protein